MSIDRAAVHAAIVDIGLADRPVCLHSSLRSFGHIDGGADAVVEAFASAGCTLLVPTFSWDAYRIPPPPDMRPERNGIDGGCSDGFENLAKHLGNLERTTTVGESTWRVYDARSALDVATHAIRRDPAVTHCQDGTCLRCRDAIAGGPIRRIGRRPSRCTEA